MAWSNVGGKVPNNPVLASDWNKLYDNFSAMGAGDAGAPGVNIPDSTTTSELDSAKVLRPDGAGGAAWGSVPGNALSSVGFHATSSVGWAAPGVIVFDSAHFNLGGNYNPATGRLTVAVGYSGLWLIQSSVTVTSASSGTKLPPSQISAVKNGAQVLSRSAYTFLEGGSTSDDIITEMPMTVTCAVILAEGDYVEIQNTQYTDVEASMTGLLLSKGTL